MNIYYYFFLTFVWILIGILVTAMYAGIMKFDLSKDSDIFEMGCRVLFWPLVLLTAIIYLLGIVVRKIAYKVLTSKGS